VDKDEYIAALRWNGSAAAQAARDIPMETAVPSCPEWEMRDLAHHLGSHHRWVAGNLDQPPDGKAFKRREEPPADDAIPDWLEAGADMLATKLDEYLGILGAFRGRRFPEAGSIHLHTTDTPGEWLVRLDAEGIHLTREHAKGDVAVRGPASDVLLVLMGRKTMGATDVFGDAPLFERFRKHASFG
jgi:hypothetical protein